jgi:hypothetical protein
MIWAPRVTVEPTYAIIIGLTGVVELELHLDWLSTRCVGGLCESVEEEYFYEHIVGVSIDNPVCGHEGCKSQVSGWDDIFVQLSYSVLDTRNGNLGGGAWLTRSRKDLSSLEDGASFCC